MLSHQTQINQHRVKLITSLHKRFVFIVHLYTFAFHYALRSTLRDYIDIRFNALENASIAISDSGDLFFYCPTYNGGNADFQDFSEPTIHWRTHHALTSSLYRYNAAKYGMCRRRFAKFILPASQPTTVARQWREDLGDSPIRGDCFAVKARVAKSYVIFKPHYQRDTPLTTIARYFVDLKLKCISQSVSRLNGLL